MNATRAPDRPSRRPRSSAKVVFPRPPDGDVATADHRHRRPPPGPPHPARRRRRGDPAERRQQPRHYAILHPEAGRSHQPAIANSTAAARSGRSASALAACRAAAPWRCRAGTSPQHRIDPGRQRRLVPRPRQAAGRLQHRRRPGLVGHMRPGGDRAAQPRRLQRVLPALPHQALAHEHHRKQPVQQARARPTRIGHPHARLLAPPHRTARRTAPQLRSQRRNPALRMPWRDRRSPAPDAPPPGAGMDRRRDRLLARVRAGRQPARPGPPATHPAAPAPPHPPAGRGGGELQIAR